MRRREFLKLTAGSAAATMAPNLAVAQAALSKINHFVVLMLENRSFDNLLGRLYPKSDTFDGLSGDEFNLDPAGRPIYVNNLAGMTADVLTTPDPNPGERWTDINEQLFGVIEPAAGAIPQMNGFVLNYLKQTKWPSVAAHFVEPSSQAEFSPTPVSQIRQRTQQRHLVDFFETFKLGVFWKALAKNLHCPDDSLIRIPQGDRTNQDWQMTPVLMMKM